MKPAEEFHSSYLATCVLNAFFSYTAIMLNIVTIHAIRKTPSISKPLKILLLNLAVSDLGVGLTAAPLHAAFLAMQVTQNTEKNATFDRIKIAYLITTNIFICASGFLVTALIADRFLSIRYCLRYRQLVTPQHVVAVVMSIWVFSAVLSILRVFLPPAIAFAIFGIVGFFFIPTVTCATCKTYSAARRQVIHASELIGQQTSQNGEHVNVARLRKFAMAAVYLYLVLLVCYVPNICTLWTLMITLKPIHYVVQRYTLTLVFINSSLNPLIYCWKMRNIRKAVMNILRTACSR